jgi:replicative DNA helicase
MFDDTPANAMPHSLDAEEAVIGSVLINPDCFYDVSVKLPNGSREFYIQRLAWMWDAFAALTERRSPVDTLTVCDELSRVGRLEEIGGPAYVMQHTMRVPTSLHAESYADIVRDRRIRRDLLTAARRQTMLAYDTSQSIEDVMSQSMSAVSDAAGTALQGQTRSAHDVFSSLYDQVEALSRQPANVLPGVPTGLVDLDRLLGGGLQKGRFYIVGGRPGQGKTSLLLTMLYNAAYECRRKVAVFSLEMENEELGTRLISIQTSINGQKISTGKIEETDWDSFVTGIETGSMAPIQFDDNAYLTPSQLRAKCKRIQAMFGLDLVILDYIGLMNPDRHYNNKVDEVSSLSRSLKLLSRELHVPVLAAHQLSRAVEGRADGEPQMSDLRDSGGLEQDADAVMLIYQDKEQALLSHLKLDKQRAGPTGVIDLVFNKSCTRFNSLARMEIR